MVPQRTSLVGNFKTEWLYKMTIPTREACKQELERIILFYNTERPHMSIGMQTPSMVHTQTGEQKRCWRNPWENHAAAPPDQVFLAMWHCLKQEKAQPCMMTVPDTISLQCGSLLLAGCSSAEPVSSSASVRKVTHFIPKMSRYSQIIANFALKTKSRRQIYARRKVVK